MLATNTDQFQPVMSRRRIAEELGISNSRVRQLESRAIQKLRFAFRQRGLSLDDFIYVLTIDRANQRGIHV